jgi:predicted nucleic acid-binding protein
VDTGAFLALHRKADQYHRDALRLWTKLPPPIFTSNHIVDELATLLGRLAGFRYAADRVEVLYGSGNIDVICSTREDEVEALRWMRKFADKAISFTDCVSFAMMRRHRIAAAFTFDRHFRDAGFRVIPDTRTGRRG